MRAFGGKGFSDSGLMTIVCGVVRMGRAVILPIGGVFSAPVLEAGEIGTFVIGLPVGLRFDFLFLLTTRQTAGKLPAPKAWIWSKQVVAPDTRTSLRHAIIIAQKAGKPKGAGFSQRLLRAGSLKIPPPLCCEKPLSVRDWVVKRW